MKFQFVRKKRNTNTIALFTQKIDQCSCTKPRESQLGHIPLFVREETERVVGDDTGGGNILLVEDEDAVRLFAARALRSKGYRVLEARTGEAAVEIIDEGEQAFDLLVTDMVMPRVDGATLIRHARKVLPDLPVVCISGYTQDSVAKEVAELPNVHFLPKPFSLKQLATRVKDALKTGGDSQNPPENLNLDL